MNKSRSMVAGLLVLLLLLGAAYYFWQRQSELSPQVVVVPETRPVTPAQVAPTPLAAAPAEPVIQHPVEVIETPEPKAKPSLPALAQSDARLKSDLTELMGRKNVLGFLQLDGFVRRVVATVDNLGREHAAPALWPVNITPGRFSSLARGEIEVINPDNSQRYAPFVALIESIDSRSAVQFYGSLYPLFQQAYEELGYPKQYFNDRLVAVIDILLAAPVREDLVAVSLVKVKGPIASERPWVRYEFGDEKLQSLAAGQKMLIRTGAANHRRLRAKLMEIRKLVTKAELPPASAAKN